MKKVFIFLTTNLYFLLGSDFLKYDSKIKPAINFLIKNPIKSAFAVGTVRLLYSWLIPKNKRMPFDKFKDKYRRFLNKISFTKYIANDCCYQNECNRGRKYFKCSMNFFLIFLSLFLLNKILFFIPDNNNKRNIFLKKPLAFSFGFLVDSSFYWFSSYLDTKSAYDKKR
jgi:hypothetical protein